MITYSSDEALVGTSGTVVQLDKLLWTQAVDSRQGLKKTFALVCAPTPLLYHSLPTLVNML